MESLKTIQILSKLGKVLSKIIFICCIIGAVGCVVGMVCLPFADTEAIKIGGVTIHGLIENRAGMNLNSLYPLMSGSLIVCIGEAVIAKFAEVYFTNELAAGTPFTTSGAKELLRLGILTISVPLGTLILALIVSGVIADLLQCGEAFKLEGSDSVTLGVMFIVMSFLCKYGAEVKGGKHKKEKDNEKMIQS